MHRHVARIVRPRRGEIAVFALAAVLLAGLFLSDGGRSPISSAETRFVEKSPSGLQIVPASCPSNPHDGGQCSGSGPCDINFVPSPVAQGQSSTLFWRAPAGNDPYTLSYPGGSNTVPNTGNGTVGGDTTKMYTFSYNVRGPGDGNPGGGTPVSCTAILTVCPAGQTVQNGQCVPNQQCPAGQHLTNSQCICDATNQPPVNGQCPNPGGQCTMSWSPAYVSPGQNSTLSWNIPGPGIITYPGGSFPVTQSGSGGAGAGQSDMTYSFSGSGASCSATLHVCPAGQVPNAQGTACVSQGAVACSVNVDPRFLPPSGGNITVSWTSQNATSMWSPDYGNVRLNGSVTGVTGSSYTYRFTASGPGGSSQCQDSVTVCPVGYTATREGCVQQQCTQPPVCSVDYRRVVNACTGATIQTCTSSQTCVNGQCLNIGANITVAPSLVRSGETTRVTWNGTNVSSCRVTEDNPNINDTWSCNSTASCTASHTNTSSPIDEETIYTLLCTAPSGASVTKTATVRVIPVWIED